MRKNFVCLCMAAMIAVFGAASVALAAVQMYTGVGTCTIGDIGTREQARNIAYANALQNAREQSGEYLRSYSRTTGATLADNEIVAVANNTTSIIGQVEYTETPETTSGGQIVTTYMATIRANVDTSSIDEWLARDVGQKAAIVRQSETAQKDIRDSIKQMEDLSKEYDKAQTEKDRESIKHEFNEADKKLLAGQKLDEGLELHYKGDYDGAIRRYDKALELDPKFASAYNNRGIAYDDTGEHDQAIADYNRALALNPKYADAYCNRGVAYQYKGEYDRAIADCNQALALNPKLGEAYNNRGLAYQYKGEYDRAIADYNQALELTSKDAVAHYNRGNAYRSKGEYDRAIDDFNQALALNPKYADAYCNRGVAYRNKGEYDRAIDDFNQALAVNPKFAIAYYNRGIAYDDKGEYDQAIADYNQALELNPKFVDAYINRGIAYVLKGEHDRAIADWEQVLKIDPDNADAKELIQLAQKIQRGQ